VQFPAGLNLGPSFLMPDDLIAPEQLSGALGRVGTETLEGRAAERLALRQPSLGAWREVQIEVWRDPASGAVLGYDLLASGPDPLADGGEGVLAGRFRVTEVGPQVIEPVGGCAIDLPLPADAQGLVRLPGLVAFDTPAGAEAAAAFYRGALPALGWQALAEAQGADGALVLSYQRGAATLDVHIEPGRAGARVELLQEAPG
jgi:hypothetical protein